MKSLPRMIAHFAVALVFSSALVSCANAPKASCEFNRVDRSVTVSKEISVVISPNIGFVDFENVLASTAPKIHKIFEDRKNATLSVVLADGDPEIESSSIIEVEKAFSTQTDVDEEIDNAMSEISRVYRCALGLDGISSGPSDESNLALALSKAAGAFETSGSQREIFVLSNGVSTAGQVNFVTDGMPKQDSFTQKVDDYTKALVDLQSAEVTWIGLGQTDTKYQEELDTQAIDALIGFWSLFVERSNGIVGSIKQGNVVYGKPNPNSLEISKVDSGFEKICVSADLGIEQGLVFKEYSSEFKNESLARESIKHIADQIRGSECAGRILVTGFVSSDQEKSKFDGKGNKSLSLQRAKAVKDVLEEFGVTNTKAIGAGWGGVDEWNPDGSYNNNLGEKNRIVKIQEEK